MVQKITTIGKGNSVFNQFLYELREVSVQGDRMRFRQNIERCSEIMAYEISKGFDYESREVTTPLGTLDMDLVADDVVLVSILRAGVPMHYGFLRMFDKAENGFISAYRHHTKGNEFIVKVEYSAIPSLNGKTLLLIDPMIASGKSAVLSYQAIVPQYGKPKRTIIAGIIGSEEGVEYVSRNLPNVQLYLGAIDGELTAKSYIVPGLGDAGDLAFGSKE